MPRREFLVAFLVAAMPPALAGSVPAAPTATVTVYPSWSLRTHSHPERPGPFGRQGGPGDAFEIHIDGRLLQPFAGDWFLCVRGGEAVDLLAGASPEAGGTGRAFFPGAQPSPVDPEPAGRPSTGMATLSAAQPIPTNILAVTNAKAYPNPFNPFLTDVTLEFSINQDAAVSVYVYDWAGQFVNQLDLGSLTSGAQSVLWGGQTQDGRALGNGTYLVRIVASTLARQSAAVLKVVVWNEE
jgi:hypothetical protein